MGDPMAGRFYRFLFGDVPVELRSSFSLQESVERLKLATKRSLFSYLFSHAAAGRVTPTSVRLQRVIPMFGNSFKPIFVGRFVEIDGRVVLKGKFTMFRISKILTSIWFWFCLLWTCFTTIAVGLSFVGVTKITPDTRLAYLFPFIGAGFVAFGTVFVRFSWWLSRSDMDYLLECMAGALQS